MRADDGCIDGARKAEIVGIDNESAVAQPSFQACSIICGEVDRTMNRSQELKISASLCGLLNFNGRGPKTSNFPRSSFCSSRQ